jgi:hypothetical protein
MDYSAHTAAWIGNQEAGVKTLMRHLQEQLNAYLLLPNQQQLAW